MEGAKCQLEAKFDFLRNALYTSTGDIRNQENNVKYYCFKITRDKRYIDIIDTIDSK